MIFTVFLNFEFLWGFFLKRHHSVYLGRLSPNTSLRISQTITSGCPVDLLIVKNHKRPLFILHKNSLKCVEL